MRTRLHRALSKLRLPHFSVAALLAVPLLAATPAPKETPHRLLNLHIPTNRLHTEFVVEVNRRGQVVRVKSAQHCDNPTFNAQTYGNVLQMWIRHPDGTADVGLYRVTYDYDPRSRTVFRRVAIISHGGNWGNAEGAANEMLDIARREAADERAHTKPLPALQNIIDKTPTPHP